MLNSATRGLKKRFLLVAFVLGVSQLMPFSSHAQNGRFDAPRIEDYLRLSPRERKAYLDRFQDLDKEDFIVRANYSGQSFHATARGQKELLELTQSLIGLKNTVGRYVFIGRSGSALQAFLQGFASVLKDPHIPPQTDLPYSHRQTAGTITAEQKNALRDHLRINQLDPVSIAEADKPILFIDAVYTGTGALSVLNYIMEWAEEFKIADAVRSNIHFFALHPAEMLARTHLEGIARASAKETGHYYPPSDEEIARAAESRSIPQKSEFQKVASRIIDARISRDLYVYGSIQIENAQASFTPNLWTQDFDRYFHQGFEGLVDNNAFLEIFFLMHEGRRVGNFVNSMRGCTEALSRTGEYPRVVE